MPKVDAAFISLFFFPSFTLNIFYMLFLLLAQIQCILEWKAIAWEFFPFVSWEYSVNSIGTTTQYYKMRNSIVIYFSTRRKHFLAAQICMQCIYVLVNFQGLTGTLYLLHSIICNFLICSCLTTEWVKLYFEVYHELKRRIE